MPFDILLQDGKEFAVLPPFEPLEVVMATADLRLIHISGQWYKLGSGESGSINVAWRKNIPGVSDAEANVEAHKHAAKSLAFSSSSVPFVGPVHSGLAITDIRGDPVTSNVTITSHEVLKKADNTYVAVVPGLPRPLEMRPVWVPLYCYDINGEWFTSNEYVHRLSTRVSALERENAGLQLALSKIQEIMHKNSLSALPLLPTGSAPLALSLGPGHGSMPDLPTIVQGPSSDLHSSSSNSTPVSESGSEQLLADLPLSDIIESTPAPLSATPEAQR